MYMTRVGPIHSLGCPLSDWRSTDLLRLMDVGHAPSHRLSRTARISSVVRSLCCYTILLLLRRLVTNKLQYLSRRPLSDVPAVATTDRASTAISTDSVCCTNAKLGPSCFPPGHEKLRYLSKLRIA